MKYQIQHRIHTLVDIAVKEDDKIVPEFTVETTRFSAWEFNIQDGSTSTFWLAEGSVEAPNLSEAVNAFKKVLDRIEPRVSLISQSYIESLNESYLVMRSDKNFGFFQYTTSEDGSGLMFTERELKALQRLLGEEAVSEAFYYYWNDAVNTIGYTARLLLMFSAIEALARGASNKADKIKEILGEKLATEVFGIESNNSSTALRNRLVHGEYLLKPGDSDKNYVELIHECVMAYFNRRILKEALIPEEVVSPQRQPWVNKTVRRCFIKAKDNRPLILKEVMAEFDRHQDDINQIEHYDIVRDVRPQNY